MPRKILLIFILVFALFAAIGSLAEAFSKVIHDGDSTYIVDRQGERWDVTQARSIGFMPERFQHGIGRNAFTPLDDSSLTKAFDHFDQLIKVLPYLNLGKNTLFCLSIP